MQIRNSCIWVVFLAWSLTIGAQSFPAPDSTSLPLIMINTNGGTIMDEPKIEADMKIIHTPGNFNKPSDTANVYNGRIAIEYRGQHSQLLPQKPYGFETINAYGNEQDMPLFHMPAENDWILLANYNDKAFSRNALAFHLFDKMGHYAPRTMHCEVVINGEYMGIFVLTEKIKRDKNRVDIAKLDTTDKEGIGLTGGYLFANDYFWNDSCWESPFRPASRPDDEVYFIYKYPESADITGPQKEYISSFVSNMEATLFGPDFMNPVTGYRAFVSVKSFMDYFIVNELARNVDGFNKSCYYFKNRDDKGGKLHAGPVWDFDWAWKNIEDNCYIWEATDGSNWAHRVNDCNDFPVSPDWVTRMLEDSNFCNELHTRYYHFRQTLLSNDYINHYIDSVAGTVALAQQRHYERWPILGVPAGCSEVEYPPPATFEGEIRKMKNWIALRLAWLDANMPGRILMYPSDTVPNDTVPGDSILVNLPNPNETEPLQIRIFPNPVQEELNIESTRIIESLEIFNQMGQLVYQHKESPDYTVNLHLADMLPGLYIVRIKTGGNSFSSRFIRQRFR
jgi:hypothetical protein